MRAHTFSPSILEAALALRTGLSIREIAHSEASEDEIEDVHSPCRNALDRARAENRHAICFLTGVPGSGKTLFVSLSLAHSDQNKGCDAFRDRQWPAGASAATSVYAKKVCVKGPTHHKRVPRAKSTHRERPYFLPEIIRTTIRDHRQITPLIFDEAQRTWNRAQNLRKFRRDYSEPEMLLRIMERHEDWAMVVALVGGGQEVNDGEAGLEEWGRALLDVSKDWLIYASPEVLQGRSVDRGSTGCSAIH